MKARPLYNIINLLIALIWLANGLLAKVLNLVPRHQAIVAEILGQRYALELTFIIGISEIFMALWIVWGFYRRLNATMQISVITLMNILEITLVPDLLLWGWLNAVFAAIFCLLIYYNEFILKPRIHNAR